MSRNDIVEKLHKQFKDEAEGIEYYIKLSEEAEQLNEYSLAQKLLNMARDEYVHGNYIKEQLERAGITATEEEKQAWNKSVEHLFGYVK